MDKIKCTGKVVVCITKVGGVATAGAGQVQQAHGMQQVELKWQ